MDMDDLDRLAGDPRMIPGIYNYCDRWCERCPYTSRCLSYAHGRVIEAEFAARKQADEQPGEPRSDDEKAVFWQQMDAKTDEAADAAAPLADGDDEGWLGPTDFDEEADQEEFEEFQREERRRDEEARRHPAARAAWLYMRRVERWHKQHDPLIERTLKAIDAPPPAAADAPDPGVQAALLNDAFDVICWYEHYLWVKLMRALHRDPLEDEIWDGEDDDEDGEELYLPKDSDMSAKLALIGMDRSIAAWGDIRDILPELADECSRMVVHLARLRRLVEEAFPDARGTLRPGFDTPPPTINGR